MPYPTLFDPEAMELMAGYLAEERSKTQAMRAEAVRAIMECKMPLIQHLFNLRLRCCAPCHRWRMGK